MILPKAWPQILACASVGESVPVVAIFLCMRHADGRSKVAGRHVRGELGKPSENLPRCLLYIYSSCAPLAPSLNWRPCYHVRRTYKLCFILGAARHIASYSS